MTPPRPPSVPPAAAARRWREWFGLTAIFLGITWFYAYVSVQEFADYRFMADSGDYYHQLVDGFMDGQTGMRQEPPATLMALANPYDPVQRAAAGNVGLHDASYYRGHYYLYFGAAPALVLFLPFRLLTGVHFSQHLAVVLFCASGFAAGLALLLDLRRRYFPTGHTRWVWAAALLLGLGNFCGPMLSRNGVWEVPIAAAYCFSSLGFWMLFRAMATDQRRWYLGSSLMFGLAVGSRPQFVLLGVAFGIVWLWDLMRRHRRGEALAVRGVAAEFVVRFSPQVVCILALLVYNHARFGSFLEFGTKYQLAGYNQFDAQWFGFLFLPANLYFYLLAPAQLSRYFPFFEVVRTYPGTLPSNYGGIEDPYGILSNLPYVWLALAVPWFVRRWPGGDALLRRWLVVLAGAFVILFFVTLCFSWATNRYMVDFLPPLLSLGAVGVLLVGSGSVGSRWFRGLASVLTVLVVLYTATFNLLVSFQHNGLFKAHRPEDFARMAAILNRPALWWEAWRGQPFGPVQMKVRFPVDRPGRAEPLLVTGVSYKSDYIYVYYYPDLKAVQLAFTLTNRTHLLSQRIPLDLSQPHQVGIESGALYPTADHPYFAGWKPADIKAAKETLRVTLDGITYLDTKAEFYEGSPGFVRIGENKVSHYIEPKFTGKIAELRREPLPPAINEFAGGAFLRLGLRLAPGPAGRSEPLVATQSGLGRTDILFLETIDATTVRFGVTGGATAPVVSPPLAVNPDELQVVEASLGSFYRNPANGRDRELQGQIVVRLNDRTVWTAARGFEPADGPPVIGRNSGLPGVGAAFSGQVVNQLASQPFPSGPLTQFAVQAYWMEAGPAPAYGPVRLHFTLPAGRLPKLEPMVVTGAAPVQADHLALNYTIAGRFGVNYVHAGNAGPQSARVPVDASVPHVLEVDMPSLYPSENDPFFASASLAQIAAAKRGRARVAIDGRLLFDTPVDWSPSPADWISFGSDRVNPIYGQRFSGQIDAVERLNYGVVMGLDENAGPLELTLRFPAKPTTGAEVILATGEPERADTLVIVYESARRAHLEIRSSRGPVFAGPGFALDATDHLLRVDWGGLQLAGDTSSARTAKVLLDGASSVEGQFDFVRARPLQELRLGAGDKSTDGFSGRIRSVRRLP